jgi:hypothetical protein
VQASGQAVLPVCVPATGPYGIPEFHISGPYAMTVATPTMAAGAVPRAACARRRWGIERPGLTVFIDFLQLL